MSDTLTRGVRIIVREVETLKRMVDEFSRFARMPKPVIAAVNGPAVGMGMDIALACDLRIAAESARFGMLYIKRGLVPDEGGAWFLPRLVGMAKAYELIFTGDWVYGPEAAEIGLVNRCVPDDQLMSATRELAEKIAFIDYLKERMPASRLQVEEDGSGWYLDNTGRLYRIPSDDDYVKNG